MIVGSFCTARVTTEEVRGVVERGQYLDRSSYELLEKGCQQHLFVFWILRRRIHQDLISLFKPLCIIRLIGEVNKEDEGITVLMAACHQVLKSSSKKERKKGSLRQFLIS